MPTTREFDRNRRFERMFGLKPMDFYGDEHLSMEEVSIRRAETNEAMRRIREDNKGEILGTFEWDEEIQDLKFTPALPEPPLNTEKP